MYHFSKPADDCCFLFFFLVVLLTVYNKVIIADFLLNLFFIKSNNLSYFICIRFLIHEKCCVFWQKPFTFQNCNMCINTGMSIMLIRPLMLMSLNMIRLLQSSRLGFSARYALQWARKIFCSCVTSSSGGYLTMSLDKSGFPSGCKYIPFCQQIAITSRNKSRTTLTNMTVSSKNSAEIFLNTILSSFTSLK